MVPSDSHRVSRALRYSGVDAEMNHFRLRGCHPLWPAFPDRSASDSLCHSVRGWSTLPSIPQLHTSNASRLTLIWFRLVPVRSPLLGESHLMSFPPGT